MKIGSLSISAMHKWLFAICSIILLACIPARVYSIGGYVNDPAITVPANAYTTFSMVYNGKRYYLGVDTIQAKAGKDTIAVYDEPCYAAMWIAGPMWSPTGAILPNKDYTRTVKSVWLNERITDRTKKEYLSVGPDKRSYALLVMTDEKNATMWHTAKDFTVQSQYMHGFTYAYSDDGTETYRYLAYDPVYGFSRLYGDRPAVSQRISVWDRKTGDDLVFKTNPSVYSFGLKTSSDTTKIRFSSQVAYYPHVDRFRSRYARVDVYTSEPEVIEDQSVLLAPPYSMGGHYEWKSNPRGEGAYNGQSHMKMWTFTGDSTEIDDDDDPETPDVKVPVMGWRDSTLLWVSDTKNTLINNEWVDTIFVIGASPIDRPECRVLRKTSDGEPAEGDYLDHVDWLYVHLRINGNWYKDSIQLTRETFHVKYTTSLTMDERPDGWEFPYHYDGKKADGTTPIGTDDTKDFEISARYRVTVDTLHANGAHEKGRTLEEQTLDLTAQTPKEIASVKYNELIVNAYEPGTTTPCSWLTVSTPDRKTIRLQAAAYNEKATVDRVAEVHYTYRYLHSTQEGDWSELTRIIWISQLWKNSGVAGLYAFSHKPTAAELQEVYEKNYTVYAIPDEDLSLPLHRDCWGYYRWFIYDGANKDHDMEQEWDFGLNAPINKRYQDFMPINYATSAASRGRWDVIRDINAGNTEFEPAANEHFEPGTKTTTPAVYYPNSITKTGKVACDVSAYYDIQTTSSAPTAYVKQNLTALTEPTLSYRNVFDIQPAKIQADTLATYKGNGSSSKWMEEHVVIVPAGRAFSLQQRYPVRQGDASIDEELLQYIYYANPTQTDAKIGTRTDLTDEQLKENDYYARIGKEKTIEKRYVLTLRTASELRNMSNNSTKTIILVNPRNNTGYLLGKTSREIPATLPIPTGATTKDELKTALENKLNDGGTYTSYFITIKEKTRSKDPYHNFLFGNYTLYNLYTAYSSEGGSGTQNIRWYGSSATGSEEFEIGTYSGSTADMPTGFSSGELITIWTTRWLHTGYLASGQGSDDAFDYRIYKQSNSNTAYQAWLVYEVSETTARTYNETPRWEKWNGSSWVEVERASDSDEDGYTMLANGALEFDNNVHTTANETIQYRLRTEHFQLAKFTVVTRDPAKEGPLNYPAIISEDEFHNNYETLYTLGLENFPAPATDAPTAYYHKLPWDMTELSYHYPQSVIAANRRVDTTSLLPMKGEYCFLNKFVDPTNPSHIISARDNYFLCIQAAESPTTSFNFLYPGLTCADQQIYLCFDLCNPMKENGYEPQITAELQGTKDNGVTWTPIYRFKTGEIKFNDDGESSHDWWQAVLPIDRSRVKDYDYFRCTATLTGTIKDNAFILIDRLRFVAKERPMTVFQNKATCLDNEAGGPVDIVARMDYKNASYPAGTLVAFQYQKKVGSSFVALNPKKNGITYINEAVGPDGVTVAEGTTDTCCVIRIPANDYVPAKAKGDSITTIDRVTDTTKCYVNEGTAGSPYYVMYLSQTVSAVPSDTFRVVMAGMRNIDDQPRFDTAECATERIIVIHHPIQLHINGATTEWPNYTREQLDRSDEPHTPRPANATYTVTATIADGFLPKDADAGSGKCMFDVVRTTVDDRSMAGNEVWFKNRFGCTRQQFREAMTIFRADHPDNVVKTETNWSNVRPEHFQYDNRSKAQADSIYAILNTLIVEKGLLQISLSSYGIYLADNNNAYVVLWPIPASGTYTKSSVTYPISVCATPRWFEIHSDESDYNMRFGYDNLQEGNYYSTPVIRASVTDANTALKVRIADITHTSDHAGLVIGWDSTYVVESNDPTWNPATKSFRYHQDRIVQDTLFRSYYHVPTSGTEEAKERDPHRYVTFTPVNSTYISQLTTTGCDCYNYDANGTVYDPANPGSTNNVFKATDAAAGTCNKWHVATTAGYHTPNNFTLRAGYWYKFRTAFFTVQDVITYNSGGDGECRGHSEFIVAVAPDTVRWTPSHKDAANYWNDDNNWTPVMATKPADGFKARVPMGNTKVIIDKVDEGLLPIVSDIVAEQKDTLDYGYAKNTCYQILFKPHAQMLGQEKLTYTKAFVDVPFTTGEWQTFSPALDSIYAGDMYIPFETSYNPNPGYESTGASIDTVDFAPKPFPYGALVSPLNYNPREYPFAFYQGFYNAAVHVPYYNTDTEDKELTNDTAKSKSTVDWIKTPSMRMHYAPGAPCIIQGFDATDEDGRPIVVRLPKSETTYYGYGRVAANSYRSGDSETLPTRPTEHNLAYDKYAATFNESTGISYPLKNLTAAEIFFFGNPTMALVDVYKLCVDNADKLKHEVSTYHFTAYQLMDGSNYTTKTINGPGQYFIAPQRAIGLVANSVRNDLTITLKPSHLVAITGDGLIVNSPDIVTPTPAPKRAARTKSVYEEPEKRWLYVTASNETDYGKKKAYLTLGEQAGASRGYVFGEDALSLSSGLNYYSDESYSTPLSLYTIADNQALMQDVRDTLVSVPLIFTTLPDYSYDEYTFLTFSMSGTWDKPLYLYDALTNDSVMIRNGIQVAIPTPNSDQIRYFINGAPKAKGEGTNGEGVTTGVEEVTANGEGVEANGAVIYDMLGRRVLTLHEFDLISNIQLPTGVYIIQRGTKTERMVIR